jgi:hypothetical protein
MQGISRAVVANKRCLPRNSGMKFAEAPNSYVPLYEYRKQNNASHQTLENLRRL